MSSPSRCARNCERSIRRTDGMTMPGLPELPKLNHWHAWVDNIVGKDTELRAPFPDFGLTTVVQPGPQDSPDL